jgi:hypothetical protein
MMPRSKKRPGDYAIENEDLESQADALLCKYCRVEINTTTKPSDRIKEHLHSKRHQRIKSKCLEESSSQPTLEEVLLTSKKQKEEAMDVSHEFVRAVCYGGLPFSVLDGPIADLVKRFCPAARTMPGVDALAGPYLERVYSLHAEQIKTKIRDQPVTIIVDESPELMGRPCVNTLLSFYDVEKRDKVTLMVNCSFLTVCNAASIALYLSDVLKSYDVKWEKVIALASDSAAYMKALFADLKKAQNPSMIHITCPAHLINVAVSTSLQSTPSISDVHKVVIHMGSIFKHAATVKRLYNEICISTGNEGRIPPTVVPTRWFSWFESAKVVLEMWPQLLTLVDHSDSRSSSKIQKQVQRLGDQTKRQCLFVLLKFLVSILEQVHCIQKTIEGEGVLLHKVGYLLNVQLMSVFNSVPQNPASLPSDVSQLLCMLSSDAAKMCFESCQSFYIAFNTKWSATTTRNIQEDVKMIWQKCAVLDPFQKRLMPPNYDYYENMFGLVVKDDISHEELQVEFDQYLADPIPQNLTIEIVDFWNSVSVQYLHLSTVALQILSIPVSSASVERSFSKLRKLQCPTRANLSVQKLCMQSVLFHNQEL